MSSNQQHTRRPRVVWTDDMLAALVEMRTRLPRPVNLMACAKRIGVAHILARKKARELGLSSPSYPGPARGAAKGLPRDAAGRFLPSTPPRQPGEAPGQPKGLGRVEGRGTPQAAVAPPEGRQ